MSKTKVDGTLKFEANGYGNEICECGHFALSFRPGAAGPAFGISAFASDDGCDETAILVYNNYFILNGDFRDDYLRLAEQGLNACFEFFIANADKAASTSASAGQARAALAALAAFKVSP